MRKQIGPGPDELRRMGYEQRDVSLPTIRNWVTGLFVFVGVASGLMLIAYTAFVPYHPERETPAPGQRELRQPVEPRLQADPVLDIAKFRAQEEQILQGYAWTDRSRGRVRIPVEQAIQRMASQLPVGHAQQ